MEPLPEKAYALMAILAPMPEESAHRGHIRTILWADSNRDKATANLRQLIARIHRIEARIGLQLILCEGESISLNAGPDLVLDYSEFLSGLPAPGEGGSVQNRCERMLRLWQGTLLEGIAFGEAAVDEWLEGRRDQMRQDFLEAGCALLGESAAPVDFDAQWRLATRMLEIDAASEPAYRAMMRICMRRGDRGWALRIFNRCRRILAAELGVEPDGETQRLAAELRDPVRTKEWSSLRRDEPPNAARRRSYAQPAHDIPVVTVLPPVGMILDKTADVLAKGFAEELTVGLARFRRFSIVASQTGNPVVADGASFEKALNILDIDYSVIVSLMPTKHGHRFGVRLNDVSSAGVLWATHIDVAPAGPNDEFESAIGRTVRSIMDVIDASELSGSVSAEESRAYRKCLEGRRLLYSSSLPSIHRARKMFKEALGQLPDYVPAMIGVSRTLSKEWLVRGMVEDDLLRQSLALALRASELDPLDSLARRQLGYVNLYMRNSEESLRSYEEAIRLNPHDPDILTDYADALAHSGDPAHGLAVCQRAIDLDPTPREDYAWTLGSIFYQMGEYQAALAALRPMEDSAATARLLSACAAQLREVELARRHSRTFRGAYPKFDIDNIRNIVPNRRREDTEHLIDGLRLAGLG